MDDFETAVAEYIDWFNHRRLHGQQSRLHHEGRVCTSSRIGVERFVAIHQVGADEAFDRVRDVLRR
ncbi:hypothetical protein [uncultured Serinicoccus sp.]|uniref:hypothetical protein n=1 Tax=uncultured Serinicoccus sp. TaxID=735514 RepID=UPI00345A529B